VFASGLKEWSVRTTKQRPRWTGGATTPGNDKA